MARSFDEKFNKFLNDYIDPKKRDGERISVEEVLEYAIPYITENFGEPKNSSLGWRKAIFLIATKDLYSKSLGDAGRLSVEDMMTKAKELRSTERLSISPIASVPVVSTPASVPAPEPSIAAVAVDLSPKNISWDDATENPLFSRPAPKSDITKDGDGESVWTDDGWETDSNWGSDSEDEEEKEDPRKDETVLESEADGSDTESLTDPDESLGTRSGSESGRDSPDLGGNEDDDRPRRWTRALPSAPASVPVEPSSAPVLAPEPSKSVPKPSLPVASVPEPEPKPADPLARTPEEEEAHTIVARRKAEAAPVINAHIDTKKLASLLRSPEGYKSVFDGYLRGHRNMEGRVGRLYYSIKRGEEFVSRKDGLIKIPYKIILPGGFGKTDFRALDFLSEQSGRINVAYSRDGDRAKVILDESVSVFQLFNAALLATACVMEERDKGVSLRQNQARVGHAKTMSFVEALKIERERASRLENQGFVI